MRRYKKKLRDHHDRMELTPEEEMRKAEAASLSCDLFLAIGSSLAVQPAASFPVIAAQNGARLVIINRDETPFDEFADLVVREDIGSMLEAATAA